MTLCSDESRALLRTGGQGSFRTALDADDLGKNNAGGEKEKEEDTKESVGRQKFLKNPA